MTFLFIISLTISISAVQIHNPNLPMTSDPNVLNYSTLNVNNSQFLRGLTPLGVASLFTEIDPIWTSEKSSYWKVDGTSTAIGNWDLDDYNFSAQYVEAEIGNFTELYTSNDTLHIGNVTLTSRVVDNQVYLDIPNVYINTTAYIGDGGFLSNISFDEGNITTNGSIKAGEFNGSNFYGGNFTGDYFFGFLNWSYILNAPSFLTGILDSYYLYLEGTEVGFNETRLNETIESLGGDTRMTTAPPYLYNDSTTIYFNETELNDTIDIRSEVKVFNYTLIIPVISGSGTNITSSLIDFEITQITVTPPGVGSYRFQAGELATGNIIDRDRIPHNGIWDISKSYAIDNQQVQCNISSAIDGNYTVTIKYLDNFKP